MTQIIIAVASLLLCISAIDGFTLTVYYFMTKPILQIFANQHETIWPGIPVFSAYALVTFLYCLISSILKKQFSIFPKYSIWVYIIIVLSLISCTYSVDFSSSISQSIRYVATLSIAIIVYNSVDSKYKFFSFLLWIMYSATIPIIIGFYQYFSGSGFATYFGLTDRMVSTFGFPNMYGIYLALIMFSTLIILVEKKKNHGIKTSTGFIVAILIATVVSTVLAKNRGTWIALALSFLLAYPFYSKYAKMRYYLLSGGAIGLVGSGYIITRFMELKSNTPGSDTFTGRLEMWRAIVNFLPNIPFGGFGSGTSQIILDRLMGISQVPHNDYLRLLIETGAFSLLIYIIFLLKIVTNFLKVKSNDFNWHIHYFGLVMIFYWCIISCAQNIIHSGIVFPLMLSLVFVLAKYDTLKEG